jgi:pimeloyl-ACP methyl ester carboxylesterase
VANDTGGGLTQILMTRHPERIGRVVLTPSDAFELFPPPPFNLMVRMLRLPGATWLSARLMQIKALRPAMFGVLVRRPIPDEIMASYLTPCRRDAGIRRDLRSVGTQVHRRHTLAAAAALPEFTKPVLLAWAEDEKLFRGIDKRLLEVLPDARVVEIADSRTLVPEDQPDRLAELIIEFTGGRNADRLTAHPTGSLRGDSDGPDGDGSRAVR